MRNLFVIGVAAAALAVAPIATAHTSFSGNQCGLVSAKQLAAFGISGTCKPTTLNGPGFTVHTATWSPTSTLHLSVSVNTYASASGSAWSIAMKTLQILPGGHGKKVGGIGSLAYETGGGSAAAMNFVVGKQIVDIQLHAKSAVSLQAFNAFAKSVAAKL